MVGLISLLAGEIIYEVVKFIIMLLLLVGGVCIGRALRKRSDAKKAAKVAGEEVAAAAEINE